MIIEQTFAFRIILFCTMLHKVIQLSLLDFLLILRRFEYPSALSRLWAIEYQIVAKVHFVGIVDVFVFIDVMDSVVPCAQIIDYLY